MFCLLPPTQFLMALITCWFVIIKILLDSMLLGISIVGLDFLIIYVTVYVWFDKDYHVVKKRMTISIGPKWTISIGPKWTISIHATHKKSQKIMLLGLKDLNLGCFFFFQPMSEMKAIRQAP
ncbi:hypothetical protein EGW08_013913 [Elysia chlorotica]|uniref:Uncharacterized protein n=1 Tax=Elysia chlorotica TaxID=188477 RepID=A0A433T9T1_ELYCH|nr:hypothetical protein EGW08_013913 [Elysia chlorotica]